MQSAKMTINNMRCKVKIIAMKAITIKSNILKEVELDYMSTSMSQDLLEGD